MRWGDMDAQAHINNTVYFRYMEQARITFFDSLGLRPGGTNIPPETSPVVMTASCAFLRALRYPGDVEVKMFFAEPGRTSVMTYYEMRPSYAADVIHAEGAAKMVWIDRQLGKAVPLPPAIRRLAEEGVLP